MIFQNMMLTLFTKVNKNDDPIKDNVTIVTDSINKLIADMEIYKHNIIVLTEQTEKLSNELERIINEDVEAYNLNISQIQRLQKLIYDNKKLLQEEIEALNALENYVKGQPTLKEVPNNNVPNPRAIQGRPTYSRKN